MCSTRRWRSKFLRFGRDWKQKLTWLRNICFIAHVINVKLSEILLCRKNYCKKCHLRNLRMTQYWVQKNYIRCLVHRQPLALGTEVSKKYLAYNLHFIDLRIVGVRFQVERDRILYQLAVAEVTKESKKNVHQGHTRHPLVQNPAESKHRARSFHRIF